VKKNPLSQQKKKEGVKGRGGGRLGVRVSTYMLGAEKKLVGLRE